MAFGLLSPAPAAAQWDSGPPDIEWWDDNLSPKQRRALINALYYARGDTAAPYRKGPLGMPTWYEEAVGRAVKDADNLVKSPMPGAPPMQRSRWRAFFRGGIFRSPTQALKSGTLSRIPFRAFAGGVAMGLVLEVGTGLFKKYVLLDEPAVASVAGIDVLTNSYSQWGEGSCVSWGGNNLQRVKASTCTGGAVVPTEDYLFVRTLLEGESGTRVGQLPECLSWPTPAGLTGFTGSQPLQCGAFPTELRTIKAFGLQDPTGLADPPMLVPREPPSTVDPGGSERPRVALPNPPAPAPEDVEDALEEELESGDGYLWRKYIEWLFRQFAPEGSPIYEGESMPVLPAPNLGQSPAQLGPPTGLTMPGCIGLLAGECEGKLDALGHTADVFIGDVLDTASADVELPANAIVVSDPRVGAPLLSNQAVFVTVNPSEQDMPLVVPVPQPNETYSAYRARLQVLGLLGTVQLLTDATIDTSKGPDAVVRVEPAPLTRVAPGSEVRIIANPATAPGQTAPDGQSTFPPGGGGGGGGAGGGGVFDCSDFAVREFDFGPLGGVDTDVFPFGALAWVGGFVETLDVPAAAPRMEFPFPGVDEPFVVDLSRYTGFWTGTVHPIISWAALISLVLAACSVCFPYVAAFNRDPGPQLDSSDDGGGSSYGTGKSGPVRDGMERGNPLR